MTTINPELKVKLILLGDGGVGKTSIAKRYTQGTFVETYKPSLGVDFMVKRVKFESHMFKILVFDTAGQEFISTLRKRYYSGADGAIVVYDITRRETFEDLLKWVEEVRSEVGEIQTIFVGNKIDLEDKRIIQKEEAEEFAETHDGIYLETSALRDNGITEIFDTFLQSILQSIKQA